MSKITDIFQGPTRRFERLLEPHLDGLYRLAYRFTGHQHDAEDLLQDLVVKLYQNPKGLLEANEPRPWLARSLRNLYIDTLRKENRSPQGYLHEAGEEVLLQVEDQGSRPDTDLEQHQMQSDLSRALEALKSDYRELVILHDVEGYTLIELVEVLEQPLGTLKSRLHRARQQLRKILSKKMEP
ncbi:MAG: RNA polymerase sigma factor [Gammaproteobacteria bacterium]|nr:MAG: RNA polymerase sigma factor [Gammaproteobacteria bacterium]